MDNIPKEIRDFVEGIKKQNPGVDIGAVKVFGPTEKDSELDNLKKAIEEDELCKKYGKAKIEALAKKINYHGTIINKK